MRELIWKLCFGFLVLISHYLAKKEGNLLVRFSPSNRQWQWWIRSFQVLGKSDFDEIGQRDTAVQNMMEDVIARQDIWKDFISPSDLCINCNIIFIRWFDLPSISPSVCSYGRLSVCLAMMPSVCDLTLCLNNIRCTRSCFSHLSYYEAICSWIIYCFLFTSPVSDAQGGVFPICLTMRLSDRVSLIALYLPWQYQRHKEVFSPSVSL